MELKPSTSVVRMSTIGLPLITPVCIVLTTPFSTEPMNVLGIAPPKMLVDELSNPVAAGARLRPRGCESANT